MSATTKDHFSSEGRAREKARHGLLPTARRKTSRTWDGFIRAMRLSMPVGALVLGLITVLWPYLDDREVAFTLSTDDVAKGDSSVHMTNLRYVGTDAQNRLFHVEAATGLQDSPTAPRVKLSDIAAEMVLENAGLAAVTARTGIYRIKESTLSLVGGVHMVTANGYTLDMAGAEVNLKTHLATGQGSITGHARLGSLAASRVEVRADEEEGIFSGGVKLRIVPKRPTGKPAANATTNNE